MATGTHPQVQMQVGDGELVGALASHAWIKGSLSTSLASVSSLVCLYSREGKNLDLHIKYQNFSTLAGLFKKKNHNNKPLLAN